MEPLNAYNALLARHVILAVEPNAAQRILLDSPDTAPAASAITFPPVVANSTARIWFDAQPRDGAPGASRESPRRMKIGTRSSGSRAARGTHSIFGTAFHAPRAEPRT